MNLAKQTLSDGRTVESAIRDAICQTMPTAALASGFVSAVDPGPWVQNLSRLYPWQDRPQPEEMGLTKLTAWLAARGITAGDKWVKSLRLAWLNDLMRIESWRDGRLDSDAARKVMAK